MTRIDPDALATHIEVALTCAPTGTLTALQDSDSQRRRRATFILAQHLADRLGCFEISGSDLAIDARQHASLFRDIRCPYLHQNLARFRTFQNEFDYIKRLVGLKGCGSAVLHIIILIVKRMSGHDSGLHRLV